MWTAFALDQLAWSPWKNGGGRTREIVCQPHGATDFEWRVSIATISESGPFSVFQQIDRVIMLWQGDGVALHSASGLLQRLDTPFAPFAFAGELALDCRLLGGESTDLNVMTRRERLQAVVQIVTQAKALPLTPRGLLLALTGQWQLSLGEHHLRLHEGQGIWWEAAPQAWQLTPRSSAARMVWVDLQTKETSCQS